MIFEIAPDAQEGIAHGMLDYTGLANLAAQKNYVALYVAPAVLANWKDDFPDVSMGKSCMRFHRMNQVNRAALGRLLREVREFRSQEVAGCR